MVTIQLQSQAAEDARRAVALHELGHAAVWFFAGHDFGAVEMATRTEGGEVKVKGNVVGPGEAGQVRVNVAVPNEGTERGEDIAYRLWGCLKMAVAIAGGMAATVLEGKHGRTSSDADRETYDEGLRTCVEHGGEALFAVAAANRIAEAAIGNNLDAIRRLQPLLMERGTLTLADVAGHLRKAPMPFCFPPLTRPEAEAAMMPRPLTKEQTEIVAQALAAQQAAQTQG